MKVFIVEDSELMREHLEFMLSEIPGIEMVGHAVDELGAIEHIDALLPDVVILDLNLQNGSGIDVLKYTKERHATIKVMVLTNHTDEFYVNRCMNAGADYFFDKSFQFMRVRAVIWQLAHTGWPDGNFSTLQ
jgi:DNA-binding NarL/FixJ family response regulator